MVKFDDVIRGMVIFGLMIIGIIVVAVGLSWNVTFTDFPSLLIFSIFVISTMSIVFVGTKVTETHYNLVYLLRRENKKRFNKIFINPKIKKILNHEVILTHANPIQITFNVWEYIFNNKDCKNKTILKYKITIRNGMKSLLKRIIIMLACAVLLYFSGLN